MTNKELLRIGMSRGRTLDAYEKIINELEDTVQKQNAQLELLELYQYQRDLYKERIKKAEKKISRIIDLGFDYDGFEDSKDLKGLIDALVDYAKQATDVLEGKNNDNKSNE